MLWRQRVLPDQPRSMSWKINTKGRIDGGETQTSEADGVDASLTGDHQNVFAMVVTICYGIAMNGKRYRIDTSQHGTNSNNSRKMPSLAR